MKQFKSYTDLKSFNDCCIKLNKKDCETEELFNKKWLKLHKEENIELDTIYYEKLKIIVDAINSFEPFNPNIQNTNEYKYYPYFVVGSESEASPSVGFSVSHCCYSFSISRVGSRLCFPSKELAIYAGKTFTKEYYDYHRMNKSLCEQKVNSFDNNKILSRKELKNLYDVVSDKTELKELIINIVEKYQRNCFSDDIIIPIEKYNDLYNMMKDYSLTQYCLIFIQK